MYIGVIVGVFIVICILLACRVHIKQGINNLSFKYRYSIATKGTKKPMARQTEQAYIKGLNQGYALAKAQYENRSAILYQNQDMCICGECGYEFPKPFPNFCMKCGCKFTSIQTITYNPNNEV